MITTAENSTSALMYESPVTDCSRVAPPLNCAIICVMKNTTSIMLQIMSTAGDLYLALR